MCRIRSVMVMLVVIMMAWAGLAPYRSLGAAEVRHEPRAIDAPVQSPQTPPLLDPSTDPYATIYRALRRSGWPARPAAVLAARALTPDLPISPDDQQAIVAAEREARTTLLDPNSDPYAIMYGEFRRSGWASHDAAVHAAATLNISGEEECWLSAVTIVYYEGGTKKKKSGWPNGNCWTTPGPGGATLQSCVSAMPACVNPGDVLWLKLKSTECNPRMPSACVFVYLEPPAWAPCPNPQQILPCDCFQELSPLNCAAIEGICCSSDGSTGDCAAANCPLNCD